MVGTSLGLAAIVDSVGLAWRVDAALDVNRPRCGLIAV